MDIFGNIQDSDNLTLTLRSVRMWKKGTNDKYKMAVSKMVNWAKID